MRVEIGPIFRAESQQQIAKLNERFRSIVEGVSDRQFNFSSVIGLDRNSNDELVFPATDFPAFWNHYICGGVTGKAGLYIPKMRSSVKDNSNEPMEDLLTKIQMLQQRGERFIYEWRNMGYPMSQLENDSITILYQAITSFSWGDNIEGLIQVKQVVSNLGDEYCYLNYGERKMGH